VRRSALLALVLATVLAPLARRTDAHKPITSPFTFSADVRPILAARCGRCHIAGGVAPMSLQTYADAVPWGESMRGELLAGHMPPWSVDRAPARFRNAGGLTARELNVLLTWLSGGTPPGDRVELPEARPSSGWPLGEPDLKLPLPDVMLGEHEQERVAELAVPTGASELWLRAVDLLPGTPSIVRSATITMLGRDRTGPLRDERVLSVWVPGDEAVVIGGGAIRLRAGAKVVARIRYRKTWEYERKPMTDRSTIGFYFTPSRAPSLQAIALTPARPVVLPRTVRALAIYPDAALADAAVVVTAFLPNGRRDELIEFQPRRGWARRYWFRDPVSLPGGTRLTVRVTPVPAGLRPPTQLTRPAPLPTTAGVTLNVL
jgi:hypothetical protein